LGANDDDLGVGLRQQMTNPQNSNAGRVKCSTLLKTGAVILEKQNIPLKTQFIFKNGKVLARKSTR
jgi:hypothetical protein